MSNLNLNDISGTWYAALIDKDVFKNYTPQCLKLTIKISENSKDNMKSPIQEKHIKRNNFKDLDTAMDYFFVK